MTLYLINKQGASEMYSVEDAQHAKRIVSEWHDPENLTARLVDGGETVYDGNATQIS